MQKRLKIVINNCYLFQKSLHLCPIKFKQTIKTSNKMTKKVFQFKSVGKKHYDENEFFKFLVRQKFSLEGSKVIQWCKFDGLNVIVEALEPQIIHWAETTFGKSIETSTGYKFDLI